MSDDMMQAGASQAMQAGPSAKDVDYSCLEDEDDENSLELDPATFRAFVEGAVKDLYLAEKPGEGGAEGAAAANKTGARFGYNAYVGQVPRIMVLPKAPYNIVHCSPAISEVLGFREREMEGRSLNIAQGPMTNVALLQAKINEAHGGTRSEHAFILYTNKGEDRVVTIEFEPEINVNGEATEKVILTIDHGDWVPKKIADAEDGRAKVTVKADKPWNVEQTSPSFNDMYALKEEMILGRTLNVVFGPRTDANMFRQLLMQAKSARTQHVDMWTCRPSDMSHVFVSVSIFPVLDKGEIGHFMVVFKHDEMAGSPQFTSPRRSRPGSSPLAAAAGRMTISE
eukprot:CAMPEP_0173420842 /NCGR_PEP_ID=MMETSP1357-20121228/2157_1 /TAXON_ID=77926 /ORGANISM="Hemiselmis rufescens, Strain PCC563" /LENGTH=339 /DNA_ID=CAMNT_0014383673 /DNA_START=209 /DNA_END=1228 /DNA_ORIENTATION=-